MANSGGASILLGIKHDGTPSDWDPPNILATGSDTRHGQDCEVYRGAVLRFRDRGDAARKLADSAQSLYEAVAQALRLFRENDWMWPAPRKLRRNEVESVA